MKKPTIKSIAEYIGVSRATVDRALHGRPGASKATKEKVSVAIRDLDFRKLPREIKDASKKALRFLFVIPNQGSDFTASLVDAIHDSASAVSDYSIQNKIRHVDLDQPTELIATLDAIDRDAFDGVALFAVDASGVRDAIDRMVGRGLQVVSIVTDLEDSQRQFFIGIDNFAAGRAAGALMGRFLRGSNGKIGVIVGSLRMRDQYERYSGFDQVIRSKFPSLRVMPVFEGLSDRKTNKKITQSILQKHSDLVGIYSAGAGSTGIFQAIEDADAADRITLIVHDLSPRSAQALREGIADAVISQNTGHITRSAVRILKAICTGGLINRQQEEVGIDIYMENNIPAHFIQVKPSSKG